MSFYVKRSNYWKYFLEQEDAKELFINVPGDERQRILFKKFVNVINIELSSFCNRKCSYCPMAYVDRKQKYMDKNIWYKILKELEEIQYEGHIALNLFNEPLLDVNLVERIRQLHRKVPNAYIKFDTNGDYLTRKKLDMVIDSGVMSLLVTRHADFEFTDVLKQEIYDYIKKLKLGEFIVSESYVPGKNVTYNVNYKNTELLFCANNWKVIGNDRGGTVEHLKSKGIRTLPCNNPLREMNISYDGKFKPCCNIYFGENTNIGSVIDDGIVETYFNKKSIEYRRALVVFGEKSGYCKTCATGDNSDIKTREIRKRLLQTNI